MPFFFERAYRRMGRHYFLLYLAFEFISAFVVCLATLGLFALYTDPSSAEFWSIALFAEACVFVAVAIMMVAGARQIRPIRDWLEGHGDPLEAWRAAVEVPRRLTLQMGWQPFILIGVPISIYATIAADLSPYSAFVIFAGAAVAVAYAGILHFFSYEQFLRPVVEDIVDELPAGFAGAPAGVPLRWKLLGALPLINVITGVVVSGLSTDGSASLSDLGLDVVVAVLVAFTISLELTVLVTRSVIRPVDDMLKATEAVKRGDLDARVPITSGDELGQLAGSFNEMMEGLSEREALREAFGAYVDPDVAERVLENGELIEGQEREVTVMILDVADFTEFAQRSSARETVAFLNDLFGIAVPCVTEHGGHANKFLGDGLLAVFGAPDRLDDHADRAVAAALEIATRLIEHFDEDIRFGIGVNSGPVVVGSVGGGGRLEFAVIGDPVNVAARVEHLTRETGDFVLVTQATRCLMSDEGVELEPRGEFALKGVAEPVPIYAVPVPMDRRLSSVSKSPQVEG
ncbi:MAG: adenylate cyclase [Thermoleophilaceae bacterium]|jgi:class 3 adenylate cyclase|nr:adenylate cyclase [Thermoleophilaceae bacterium]